MIDNFVNRPQSFYLLILRQSRLKSSSNFSQVRGARYASRVVCEDTRGLLPLSPSQIKAFIHCGRLKNAYLVAIKSRLVDEGKNISEIAGKAGQIPVRDICEKWLAQQKQPKTKES